MTYTVYRITSPNGKSYIGLTRRSLEKRFKGGDGYRKNEALFKDIKFYGWKNFHKEVLQVLIADNPDELEAFELYNKALETEAYFIKFFNSTNPDFGYNRSSYSRRQGCKATDESKKRMSVSHTFKPRDLETKEKISEKMTKHDAKEEKQPRFQRNARRVVQYDTENNYITTFPNVVIASFQMGVSRQAIYNTINGHQSSTAGFIWRYEK